MFSPLLDLGTRVYQAAWNPGPRLAPLELATHWKSSPPGHLACPLTFLCIRAASTSLSLINISNTSSEPMLPTGLGIGYLTGEARFWGTESNFLQFRQILIFLACDSEQCFLTISKQTFRGSWGVPSPLHSYLSALGDSEWHPNSASGFFTILDAPQLQPADSSKEQVRSHTQSILTTGNWTQSTGWDRVHWASDCTPGLKSRSTLLSSCKLLIQVALIIPNTFGSQLINLPFPCGTQSLPPLWWILPCPSAWQVCLDLVHR